MIYESQKDRERQAAAFKRISVARQREIITPLPMSYWIDAFIVDDDSRVLAAAEYKYRNINFGQYSDFEIASLKTWSLDGWADYYDVPGCLFIEFKCGTIYHTDVRGKKYAMKMGGNVTRDPEPMSRIPWTDFVTLKE